MKRNARRIVRSQHQQNERSQGPFFKHSNDNPQPHNYFFQTKLKTGEQGDKYEKEADKAAENVANKVSAPGTAVQKQDISSADKSSMKDKEEKTVQKMENKEEERPVQKKSGPEEDKPLKMDDQKEKDKAVQKQEAEESTDVSAKHEEDKKDEHPPIMHKKEGTGPTKTSEIAERIKSTKGNGHPLSEQTQRQMEKAFDSDFSKVVVHTDSDAESLNQEMHSLAFTSGSDVYFAKGQYNPDSSSGNKLLAHELTHVIQQTGK